MLGLITDRTERNVFKLNEVSKKDWSDMTTAERIEWAGNPWEAEGANLLPPGPYYSSVVDLKYLNQEIVATAIMGGVYLYAISIVGNASNFANKTLCLSMDKLTAPTGGNPQIAAYWHDTDGFDYAGASLTSAGSIVFNTTDFPNTNNRQYLALYVYVTTSNEVVAGAVARFGGVMLEQGEVRHEYIPYTEIVATEITKGAYNYSDLNRVERMAAEISELSGLGLATKTDWTMWDVPTVADMNRYLGNIETIKKHFGVPIDVPNSMDHLTYETANNIEKILLAAYTLAAGE